MNKITNEWQAVDDAATLLTHTKLQNVENINEIARKLMMQLFVVGIYKKRYGRIEVNKSQREAIAKEFGVDKKTIIVWLNAGTDITPEHIISLAKYYAKIRGLV